MNLANKLTIFRVMLVPLMVIVPFFNITGEFLGIPYTYLIIDLIFIIASITDKLDGYMLVEMGKIPSWIPVIVVAREFLVSGYRLLAAQNNGSVIAASKWGKLKTVTQMIAIILAFVDLNSFGACFSGELQNGAFALNLIATIMMIIQAIATVFSGYDYMKDMKNLLK